MGVVPGSGADYGVVLKKSALSRLAEGEAPPQAAPEVPQPGEKKFWIEKILKVEIFLGAHLR